MSILTAIYCFFLTYLFRGKEKDWQGIGIVFAVGGFLLSLLASWWTQDGTQLIVGGGIGYVVFSYLWKIGKKFFGLGVLTVFLLVLWYGFTAFLVVATDAGWFLGGLIDIIYVLGIPFVAYTVYYTKCLNSDSWLFNRNYLESWEYGILAMVPVWIIGDMVYGRIYL